MAALPNPRVDFDGPNGRLSVRSIGDRASAKAPILFVHPINLQGRAWHSVARHLADERFCFYPDLRGHGTSHANPPFGTEHWAADCIATMDYFEVPKVHVVGGSAGGPIAVFLAVEHPERVESIVACGSSLGRAGKGPNVVGEQLRELDMDVENMFRTVIPDISLAPGTSSPIVELTLALSNPNTPEVVEEIWISSGQTDVRPIVDQVKAPATVITGAKDATAVVDAGAALATALGTSVVVIDEVGHLPMLEAPTLLAAQILEHLARVETVTPLESEGVRGE